MNALAARSGDPEVAAEPHAPEAARHRRLSEPSGASIRAASADRLKIEVDATGLQAVDATTIASLLGVAEESVRKRLANGPSR